MFTESDSISHPYVCDNLTIFLIHSDDKLPGDQFLTLQEALDQKKLIVHETSDINELAIENVSAEEVFLQAGDIVKGGLQDRVFAYDVIVPAESGKIPTSAFCVERGRWHRRGQEEAELFASSAYRVHSKDLNIACFRLSQDDVWNKVSEAQEKLGEKFGESVKAKRSATSLPLTLENEKIDQSVERYTRELSSIIDGQSDVIGYAFAINGKVNSADLYASNALFQKLWPKLLKASATEAVAEFEEGNKFESVTGEDVKACLNDATRDKAIIKQVTPRIRLVIQETEKTILRETCDQERSGAWVHRCCLVK
ncbi:MAG: hypothetical protein MOB07_08070 [Acidobacteria bacterium]|nr:hypothetical protein [Acidobacteriota bacterium]